MDTRDTAAGRRTQSGEAAPDPGQIDAIARELAALRERLRAVEAALDLPARPGCPAPPPLRALLERVAALERRAGGRSGLLPLPGDRRGAPSPDPVAVVDPPGWWPVWRERGPGLLATVLALALCAWLLRPLPGHVAPARTVAPTATVTVTLAAAGTPARVRAAPPASPGASWPPCDHDSDAGCPWHAAVLAAPAASPTVPWLPCDATVGGFCAAGDQGPAPPMPIPGDPPCPLGGTAPCGMGVASAPPAAATPCVEAADRAIPGTGCAGAPPTASPGPCPLPDERICMAER
jgi:hypothetical protein